MTKDEADDELSAKSSERAIWRGFLEHPGWALYKKQMEYQRNARNNTISGTPLSSMGGVLLQEYMKGEANGVGLALTWPEAQIELLTVDIQRLTTFVEREHEIEAEVAAGARSRGDDSDWHGGAEG